MSEGQTLGGNLRGQALMNAGDNYNRPMVEGIYFRNEGFAAIVKLSHMLEILCIERYNVL